MRGPRKSVVFNKNSAYGSNRGNIFSENENYNFRFCNVADKSRDQTSRVCRSRDYESRLRGGSKSGVPDCERENFLGANFQDLGAKTFESLATQDPKMQMKHFASCVGVNNIECKTQEEEHDVVPGSCVSRSFVDYPDEASEGGVLGSRGFKLGPTNYEAVVPRANVA